MFRVLRRLLLFVAALTVLAGCQADVMLRIEVEEDGGGYVQVNVRLDPEAASRTVLFDEPPLVEDLKAAGWQVIPPTPQPDGAYLMIFSKAFSQPDQLAGVLEEVAGKDGPLSGFTLTREKSFARRTWELRGTVDLTRGLASLSDAELTELLGGNPLGYPQSDLDVSAAGKPLETVVGVTVVAMMPGDLGNHNGQLVQPLRTTTTTGAEGVASTATTIKQPGNQLRWQPSFTEPVNLRATSSATSIMPRLWRWVAYGLAIIAACALLFQLSIGLLELIRERRRVRRRKARLAATARPVSAVEPVEEVGELAAVGAPYNGNAGAPSAGLWTTPVPNGATGTAAVRAGVSSATAVTPSSSEPRPAGGLRLLVVETSGALFSAADVVNDLLVPHARARGSMLTPSQLADWYVARVVGGLPAADFWMGVGIMGAPVLLDDAFARRYELSDDIESFLRQARSRGLELAAVGEEVPEWVGVFRQRFGLDELINWWVSASELGVRPPHPGLLQAVARTTGVPAEQSMLIARSVSLLDAARRLGFRTVQYAPDLTVPSGGHPVLRSFEQVGASS